MRSLFLVLLACASGCVAETDDQLEPGSVVINEVAPAGAPHDWFEIVNRGDRAVELSDLVFVDRPGDFVRARRFPELTLAPGERHVQEVVRSEHGFQLGDAEGVYLYHHEDHMVIDRVAWRTGAAPVRGSLARVPDVSGPFVPSRRPTPGQPNARN